jgi:hypothetical protein
LVVCKKVNTVVTEYWRQPEITVLLKGQVALAIPSFQSSGSLEPLKKFEDTKSIFYLKGFDVNQWAHQILEIIENYSSQELFQIARLGEQISKTMFGWERFALGIEETFVKSIVNLKFYFKFAFFDSRTLYEDFCKIALGPLSLIPNIDAFYRHWNSIGRKYNFLLAPEKTCAEFDVESYIQKHGAKIFKSLENAKEVDKDLMYLYHVFVGTPNSLKPSYITKKSTGSKRSLDSEDVLPPNQWKYVLGSSSSTISIIEQEQLREVFLHGCSTNFEDTVQSLENLQIIAQANPQVDVTKELQKFLGTFSNT